MSEQDTTTVTLCQFIDNLKGVEERLRGVYGYPAVAAPQAERIAHIVAAALAVIDERLDRVDQVNDLLAKTVDRQAERLADQEQRLRIAEQHIVLLTTAARNHNEQIEQLHLHECNRVSTAMAPLEIEAEDMAEGVQREERDDD